MANLKVNGKAYDSADVQISLLGRNDAEVGSLQYGDNQEHQRNYYLGSSEAKSWSMGKVEWNCTLSLSMKTVVKLEDSVGGDKRLNRIKPFDIIVSYVDDFNKIVTDIVTVKFQGQGRQVDGEMGLEQEFEMFCLGVQYNV